MKARRIATIWPIVFVGLLFTLLIGQAQALAAHVADGSLSDWVGTPTMLAGQSQVSRGELIYDDHIYDDYGADLDNATNPPVFRSNLAPTRGDYRYPTDSAHYGYNAADLREFRVAADNNGLHFLVFLETMMDSNRTAVTVAIDPDANTATGPGNLPEGANLHAAGTSRFITFWGTGGSVVNASGNHLPLGTQAVNTGENAIEVDVPWSSLGQIRGRTVRMYVVTGLADPNAGGYMPVPSGQATSTAPGGGAPGSTAVFDVGFDKRETFSKASGSSWGEEIQSSALANKEIANAGVGRTVDLAALAAGGSVSYQPPAGRFYDRIFKSDQSYTASGVRCENSGSPCVNEGINLKQNPASPGGSPEAQFLSPYQTYGLYVPKDYQRGTKEAVLLNGHSLDVNHNEYEATSPNFYKQVGDGDGSQSPVTGRLVFTPLARGIDTWYMTSGLVDVFEAWNDLKANYTVDDDRTQIGGYSMGGYMTYRIGLLMPDLFASAAAYVPPAAYQLWEYPAPVQPSGEWQFVGQTNNIVYNTLDLPYEINNAGADELVPPSGARQQAQTFHDLGRPHRFYFYPSSDHLALILADEWGHTRDYLNQYDQRNLSQTEVSYKRYPAMDLPDLGSACQPSGPAKCRFDGAYWAQRMVVRSPGDTCARGSACQTSFGQVDAVTFAFGGNRTKAVDCKTETPACDDYTGPPVPATVSGIDRVADGTKPITQQNGFEATLTNLDSIAFKTGEMGIDPSQQITGTLHGDGQTTLLLLGTFPASVTATLDGHPVSVTQTAEGVSIRANLTGDHELVVTP